MTNEVADYNSRISQGKVSCLIRAYTLDILGSFKSFKSDAICTRLRPLIYAGHLIHIYPTLPFIAEPLKSLLKSRIMPWNTGVESRDKVTDADGNAMTLNCR